MLSSLKSKLSHINTDKIDYNEFFTFTYGKEWNEKICTNIDNDEVLRIIFVCRIFDDISSSKEDMKISQLWKKASQYIIDNYPYKSVKDLYTGMGKSLGLSESVVKTYFTFSENYEDTDELLDIFYKWIYNENINNINKAPVKPIKKPTKSTVNTVSEGTTTVPIKPKKMSNYMQVI